MRARTGVIERRSELRRGAGWQQSGTLEEPLQSRNRNPDYADTDVQRLAERLLASEGAYWHFYTREDVAQVLAS